jgi:F0F1-type ATP synthase membrane subunit c/vacuolar-type H+-ATPase subunit K
MMVPRLLWGSFVFTHVMFVVMGVLLPDPAAAIPAEELQLMIIVMSGIGVSVGVVALGLVPRVFARADYFTFLILRFALAESITIFGLVLAFQGADWRVPTIFAAFGLLLHLLAAPTDADKRRHAQLRQRAA